MLNKVKKTKKTQKNPRKWIFPEKRQQEKVLRICSSICVRIFSQIQWFIFEIVSGAPLIGVCNRWYDGLGSGPLPRLAKFFWGLICPDHLAATAIGCRYKKLAYVVEGHASACPRTVGVDIGMWTSAGMLWNVSDVYVSYKNLPYVK